MLMSLQSDDVYLEAQIQNITPGPIYMERVILEPSTQYTVSDLNSDHVKGRLVHSWTSFLSSLYRRF